jgi:hypothetical protein
MDSADTIPTNAIELVDSFMRSGIHWQGLPVGVLLEVASLFNSLYWSIPSAPIQADFIETIDSTLNDIIWNRFTFVCILLQIQSLCTHPSCKSCIVVMMDSAIAMCILECNNFILHYKSMLCEITENEIISFNQA